MKFIASEPEELVVVRTGMTVVTANAAIVHEHLEPLSSFDIFLPKEDVVVILCYHKPKLGFNSMVATLKKSLAQTLVDFYVFAGELVSNDSSGELEILCNNRGVDFIEACVNLELRELDIHKPDDVIIGEKLAPRKKRGNLAVQVTELLKCGSVLLACKFDHKVADAYSTNMFLTSWSENAGSKPLSFSPSRMIFNPRSPVRHGPGVEKVFSPISSLPPPFHLSTTGENSYTGRIYHISADLVINLQQAASTETSKRTKLESFSAFLWKLLAKSCGHKREDQLVTKMAIVIDGRTRLESVYDPQACTTYFGNVLSAPYGSETVESISYKPLTWVGERVAEVIKGGANKDHFLDLIDLVETIRPEITVPTNFWPRSTDGPKVLVSSGLRFQMEKIDFGFGKPVLGFYCLPWEVDSGYVMPVSTPAGNGDWVVYMYLPRRQVEFIEKEASHVLKPFTFDFVVPLVDGMHA